jgi:hypothetical protein
MLETIRATPDPYGFAPLSILRKAAKMLWERGVTPLNPWTFTVESATGFHLVKEQPDGTVRCDCLGYQGCGVCSHAVAAVMVLEGNRMRQRQIARREKIG